jgi:hypothetical protein
MFGLVCTPDCREARVAGCSFAAPAAVRARSFQTKCPAQTNAASETPTMAQRHPRVRADADRFYDPTLPAETGNLLSLMTADGM